MSGLHVPTDGLDVVAREHARLAVAASFPPVGVRIIQDLDEFATLETELSFFLGVEVKESLHVRRVLRDLEGGRTERRKAAPAQSTCDHQTNAKKPQTNPSVISPNTHDVQNVQLFRQIPAGGPVGLVPTSRLRRGGRADVAVCEERILVWSACRVERVSGLFAALPGNFNSS